MVIVPDDGVTVVALAVIVVRFSAEDVRGDNASSVPKGSKALDSGICRIKSGCVAGLSPEGMIAAAILSSFTTGMSPLVASPLIMPLTLAISVSALA